MHEIRNFYEGHRTFREWQGRGWFVGGSRQGTAWEHMVCVNQTLSDTSIENPWIFFFPEANSCKVVTF
jgi:hypothetical protein